MLTGTPSASAGRGSNRSRVNPSDMPGAPVRSSSTPLRAGKISISVEEIDADLAREYLALNVVNRNLRRGKLTKMQRDLLAGEWRQIGDSIKFDTEGNLCDGQHRLTALVLAAQKKPGLSITTPVVRGVAPEDKIVIDTNTSRTSGDQLKIAGYSNTNYLAMAAKWLLFWDRDQMYADGSQRDVTHVEILNYVQEHPDIAELTNTVVSRWQRKIQMPAGYVIMAYRVCRDIDREAADDFFERWAEGHGLEKGSAILKLRQTLQIHSNMTGRSWSGEVWLSMLFRAWNAYRLDKPLRNLPYDKPDPDNPLRRIPYPIPDPI